LVREKYDFGERAERLRKEAVDLDQFINEAIEKYGKEEPLSFHYPIEININYKQLFLFKRVLNFILLSLCIPYISTCPSVPYIILIFWR
jgi:hypothetical protein